MEIEIDSVYDGWEDVLKVFSTENVFRIPSRHGVTFDIPGLEIAVLKPEDSRIPEKYPLPEIVKDYRERLFGEQQNTSLLYQRITDWRPSKNSKTRVDQRQRVLASLRENQNSRAAIISVWNPVEDVESDHPISPVSACFRIFGDELHLILVARSIDVWTGLVPELLAFSQLLTDTAVDLGLRQTKLRYYAFSAHVYEADFIQNILEATR
jgi:thymidylate synthase